MIVLQASHVQKSFGDNVVLADITMAVREKERVGLVGPNGAGKSTLLKILAGLTSPDAGEIIKPSHFTLGYLAQDSGLISDRTVWEEMIEAFRPVIDMEKELRQLEHRLNSPEAMSRYDLLSEEFRRQGGYSYRADTARVLKGLNFLDGQFETPINTLSGGQKTRLALAKLLLLKPHLLILDEPTNYLDLETLSWLEHYLKSYPGAMLVVSHDRYFLDQVAGIIYELENGRVTRYPGNYSRFIALKSETIHQREREYQKQRNEIARQEEFVRRNIARATTASRARSRLKALEKINPLEKPSAARTASFSFGVERQSATEVLKVKDMSIGYPGATLARKLTFNISRGERVALVGPNGIGKTTLLKTITGTISPVSGHFLLGTNVSIGYYQQEQAAAWSTKQVLNEIWDCFPEMAEKDVRSVLGSFLIRGDAVYKTMAELSGGEKARASLARLMLQKPNFLLMDEPTNHLDIYSKEALEEALRDFPGTILLVAHDRYFLNKTANRILELNLHGLMDFPGNYEYYIEKKTQMEQELETGNENENKPGRPAGENKNNYDLQKEVKRRQEKIQRRIEKIEADIKETEKKAAILEKEMQLPEVYQDVELLMVKNSQLEELRVSLENYYNEWMELNENNA